MAKAIGLRIYLITVHEKRRPKVVPSFDSDQLSKFFPNIIQDFINENLAATSLEEMERTWFFEPSKGSVELDLFGEVSYGTYGFESKLKNNKTKAVNYVRKTNDVEEIPLYYQFWFPAGKKYGFAVFQSFQGRSCVQIMQNALKEKFDLTDPKYRINWKKLTPSDGSGSVYNAAPVKSVRLLKKDAHSDIADSHLSTSAPEPVDVTLTVSAKRKKSLGRYQDVAKAVKHDGVLMYEGVEYDQAIADVRVGNKLRPVSMFGDHSNAGVIEITNEVVFAPTGHPTMASVRKEARAILTDFYSTISRQRQ